MTGRTGSSSGFYSCFSDFLLEGGCTLRSCWLGVCRVGVGFGTKARLRQCAGSGVVVFIGQFGQIVGLS